jgi:hypothetical protein
MPDSLGKQLPELETSPKPAPETLHGLTIASLGLAVLALFFFAWIADNVSQNKTAAFDATIRGEVHRYASPRLTSIMVGISFLGATD